MESSSTRALFQAFDNIHPAVKPLLRGMFSVLAGAGTALTLAFLAAATAEIATRIFLLHCDAVLQRHVWTPICGLSNA
jgi:hypothetical protein